MKRQRAARLASLLLTWTMSALVGVSGVLCLSETFRLGAAPERLWPVCIGGALVFSLGMLPRRRRTVAAGEMAALLLLLLWQRQQLLGGWQVVLLRVTTRLAKCFSVPVLGRQGGQPDGVLAAMGLLLAWAAAWAWGGGSVWPLVVVCGTVLTLCLLIVDIAPISWLVVLTGALLLLLVTQGRRRRSAVGGNCLAWRQLPAVAALLAAVIALSPPETYQRTDWITLLQETAEKGVELKLDVTSQLPLATAWSGKQHRVDLSQLGPREQTGAHALAFCAETEISYLRGLSLGVYEEQTWSAVSSGAFRAADLVRQPQITGGRDKKRLDIRTDSRMDLLYTAYHLAATPQTGRAVDEAYWANTSGSREYVVFYSTWVSSPSSGYDDYVYQQYLQLPEELGEPLAQYCQANGLTGASAEAIAGHVRSAGIYDLDTPQAPEGEDLVLYFLRESRRGYCVHFASAAALLLRSQGIPARYVMGYAVSNQPGEWTGVTEDQAHAWVEYYQRGVGWQVLDPTPADEQSDGAGSPPVPEAVEPTGPTEPEDLPAPEMENEPNSPKEEPGSPAEWESPEKSDSPQQGDALKGSRWQLLPLLAALVVLLCIAGRRYVQLCRRKRACAARDPNASLLAYWRWLTQLWQVSGQLPDPALRLLAERARFSQHAPTPEEVDALRRAAQGEVQRLRAEPARWKRLWHRWGLALY